MRYRTAGFTLVELIVVMVVIGVLAGSIAIFVKPAMENYADSNRRAALTDMADGALRRMKRDIHMAVPNSFRQAGPTCFEMVPTSGGGRFRTDADPNDAASQALDTSAPSATFDVMMGPGSLPAANDLLVIGNQSPNDVYSGSNVSVVSAITAHPVPVANAITRGTHQITLASNAKVPLGYDGGRFVIVSAAQRAVSYVCNTQAGTLTRFSGYVPGQSCTPPNGATTAVLATNLSACNFNLDPNPGITQDSGYIELRLTLSDRGSNVTLVDGAHAENMP